MEAFVWLAIFIVLLIIEFSTVNLVSIWFALAALFSMLLAILKFGIVVQILGFVVMSSILLFLTKNVIKKTRGTTIKTNFDAIVGKRGTALEDINAEHKGLVKVDGLEWTAIVSENIKKEDYVRVVEIKGSHLIVEKE